MRPPHFAVIPWAAHRSWETSSSVKGRLAYSLIDLLLSSASSKEISLFSLGSGNCTVVTGAGVGVGDGVGVGIRVGAGQEQAQPKANKTVSTKMPKRFTFILTCQQLRIRSCTSKL